MVKYWNPRRLRRIRERKSRAQNRAAEKAKAQFERDRSYTPGDEEKNARLMWNALGSALRRKMVERLADGGAMSLSKLSDPFSITLPAALRHLKVLERAGIVTTHKRGRIRFCVYNPRAIKEFATWLQSSKAF